MGKKIVFCNCGGNHIERERLEAVADRLKSGSLETIMVSDLCGLSVSNPKAMAELLTGEEETMLLACYPRTIRLLMQNAGVSKEQSNYQLINLSEVNNQQVFSQLDTFCQEAPHQHHFTELKSETDWPSWFPILDDQRCTNCGQCANFCLFGVYEIREGKVTVVNPKGCKNNCPACARICPQTAIVFPKYDKPGAISGSDQIDEVAEQQRQVRDISVILGSDIYGALEQRKIKRQSIINSEAMKRAMAEREQALKEEQKRNQG